MTYNFCNLSNHDLAKLSDAVSEERRKRFIRDKFPSLPKAAIGNNVPTFEAITKYRELVPHLSLIEAKWAVEELRK